MSVQDGIESKIRTALDPTHLEVVNESHMHSVPPGSESHFRLVVVSDRFEGQTRVARHQTINRLLAGELAVLADRFRGPEVPEEATGEGDRRVYWGGTAVLFGGSLLVLHFALSSLGAMVDLATTLSFLTAPLLSLLNHRAMLGAEVPPEGRPSAALRWASWGGIVAQSAFAVYYLALRFG